MACMSVFPENTEICEDKNLNLDKSKSSFLPESIQLELLLSNNCSEFLQYEIITFICDACQTDIKDIKIFVKKEHKFELKKLQLEFPLSAEGFINTLFKTVPKIIDKDSSNSANNFFWLRYIYSKDFWLEENLLTSTVSSFNVLEFSLGSFKSYEQFIRHYSLPNEDLRVRTANFDCNFDESRISISFYSAIRSAHGTFSETKYIVESSFDDFDKYLVYKHSFSNVIVFLYIKNHFKCWSENEANFRKREVDLPWVKGKDYSRCSVIKLCIKAGSQCTHFFDKMASCGFEIWLANKIQDSEPDCSLLKQIEQYYEDGSCKYALKVLFSRGYKVLDKMNESLFTKVRKEIEDSMVNLVIYYFVRNIVDHHEFFDIDNGFEKCKKVMAENELDLYHISLKNFVLVKSCIVMPTSVLFLQPVFSRSNRVLRRFDNDNFIRLIVRDSDKSRFISTSYTVIESVACELKVSINKGIHVDGKRFSFLGCSNSQMRSHGCWLFSGDCSNVRQWMGDLSNERCISKYMSRLGLFFTSSLSTNAVEIDPSTVVDIDDIVIKTHLEKLTYCFTDGIGKVSSELAQEVSGCRKSVYHNFLILAANEVNKS